MIFNQRWINLGGLVESMAIGVGLIIAGFLEPHLLLGLIGGGLLGLSTYSSVKTHWLRESEGTSKLVKILAGVSIICGWIPPGLIVAYAALVVGGTIVLTRLLGF